METIFYYCTPMPNLSFLQYQYLQTHWSLHELIIFLRCIPMNYTMDNKATRNNEGKYYTIYNEQKSPIFRVYFIDDHFEIVILDHIPNLPTEELEPSTTYFQFTQLYKKPNSTNFVINLYKIKFSINYYMLNGHSSTTKYVLSEASFTLLKKLTKAYPNNPEIRMEKIISIDSYSNTQSKNILIQSAIQIQLLHILNGLPGRVKIRIHELNADEIPFEEEYSVHGFSWVCPWTVEAIQKFQYIELDATFSILKPYVCMIPQIINNGVALPLGFLAGPQENSSCYKAFYNDVIELISDKTILLNLPILSDGGSGLEKFAKELNLTQFLCIHHLLKTVGANTFLGKLASKIMMSQTEELFLENVSNSAEIATFYMKSRDGKINPKFLTTCFMKKAFNEEENEYAIIVDLESNQELIYKTVLCYRNFIAAASNHAEGFHTHLKKIANEKKGIEYNLSKLIEKINKRYVKYKTGESANVLCTRVKKELLDLRNKYKIEPVKECNCNTNIHKKQILGLEDLPCIHTITDEYLIDVACPELDEKNFLESDHPHVVPSELEGKISYGDNDPDPFEEDIVLGSSEIQNFINTNYKLMVQHHLKRELDLKTATVIVDIVHEAFQLGLKQESLNDFVKFLMSELLVVLLKNDDDDSSFGILKNELIGRYFGLNE